MSILEEEWRDVVGYEGFYQVSNLGRVRSLDRYVRHSSGGKMLRRSKVLKLTPDVDGYSTVGLYLGGKSSTFKVHRLVAEVFIPNFDNLPEVNHKDGVKSNNNLGNLEWSTHKENMQHAFKTGLAKPNRGESCHTAKLCRADIPVIRARLANGESLKAIASAYSVDPSTIWSIKIRESWAHIA